MNIFDYFRETKGEMKHVSWPTKKQVTAYTVSVVIISIFAALYLGLFDYIFTEIVNRFFI